jgi:PAS domain S-box-containing protein
MAQCHDAVFITDPAGILMRVNPAFEELTGYSSLEAVGKDFSSLVARGADTESYRHIWSEIFQQRTFSGLIEFAQKSGKTCSVDVTINPVRDSRGHVYRLVGTGLPIDRANIQIPDRTSSALFEVTHRLNSDLMIIGAHAEMALGKLGADHPLSRNLQEIAAASRRSALSLREFLDALPDGKHRNQPIRLEECSGSECLTQPKLPPASCDSSDCQWESPSPPIAEVIPRDPRTVMIVEDEALIRESATEFLSRTGYRVLAAASGEEAVQKLQAHSGSIELLVIDMLLPHMSGREVSQQAAGAHPEAKVLFVSGYSEGAVLGAANWNAADHFLQKPFSLRTLAEKIEQMLASSPRAHGATAGN